MAVHGSGTPLAFTEIVNEFGGVVPHSISEYYRGGIYVDNGPPQNAGIPTSGVIGFNVFYGSVNAFSIGFYFTSNVQNFNLRNECITYGWDGIVPVVCSITVPFGITVWGNGAPYYAMVFDGTGTGGQFPAGSSITLNIGGSIVGQGGSGGTGGTWYPHLPIAGGAGMHAIYTSTSITINNSGTIAGGGGGGGGAAVSTTPAGKSDTLYCGGGGGGGGGSFGNYVPGLGACNGSGAYVYGPWCTIANGKGYAGTSIGGIGGPFDGHLPVILDMIRSVRPAGNGGNPGMAGAAGASHPAGWNYSYGTSGAGGAAGYYIVGNAWVTWTSTGTRLGNVA